MTAAPAFDASPTPSPYDVAWSDTALHHVHAMVRSIVAASMGYSLLDRYADSLPFILLVLGFAVYALVLQWLAIRESAVPDAAPIDWVDAGWYLALVAAGGGVGTVFPAILFVPVLFGSLQRGFAWGFSIAAASALVMLAQAAFRSGHAGLPPAQDWVVPVALLVLGYLIARWSSSVVDMGRYITLTRQMSELSNPRMGLTPLMREVMARLQAHLEAEVAVLVTTESGEPRVFRSFGERAEWIAPETASALATQLLAFPARDAVMYRRRWWRDELRCYSPVGTGSRCQQEGRDACLSTVNLLECRALISAPLYHRGQTAGRLVLANRRRPFHRRDIGLLRRVAETISALLENVALVERLVGEAAEYERKRLSRDLHDSAIQPFIGVKFGLEALRRKLSAGTLRAEDVDRLVSMASSELAGLRGMMGGLREPGVAQDGSLLCTVRRQAERFSQLFGIHVDVSADGPIPDDKALEGEIFHMVGEGLSNVWRHTEGRKARIHLRRDQNWLTLQILNECGQDKPIARFMPASIAERAASLGGSVQVESTDDGHTAVTARVPCLNA